jgi:hypothetical protein
MWHPHARLYPLILCFSVLLVAACDGDDAELRDFGGPDDALVPDTAASDGLSDTATSDLPGSDTMDASVPDTSAPDLWASDTTPSDEGAFADPCCASADQCAQPQLPLCGAGLTCYVIPGGPYTDVGSCTTACNATTPCPQTFAGATCSNGNCLFPCDPTQCSGGTCTKGEQCPPELTCRGASGPSYCMP